LTSSTRNVKKKNEWAKKRTKLASSGSVKKRGSGKRRVHNRGMEGKKKKTQQTNRLAEGNRPQFDQTTHGGERRERGKGLPAPEMGLVGGSGMVCYDREGGIGGSATGERKRG